MFASRNSILQKETWVLKVAIQQKDLDIKSLNELLAIKEKTIEQYNATVKDDTNQLKKTGKSTPTDKKEKIRIRMINKLEKNDQAENETFQLNIELDNLKKEYEEDRKYDLSKDEHIKLLKLKDLKLVKLENEILKEKQIIAHVQVTQEKEILEKEKKISTLNDSIKK